MNFAWEFRRGLNLVLAGLSLLACVCCRDSQQAAKSSAANVLLISIDTTRADALGCYGSTMGATPCLDDLASRGVLFERAFSPVPMTLPSHATMLTGLNPPRHSVRENSIYDLPESALTLAEELLDHGYRTFAVVSSIVMLRRHGLGQGFSVYDQAGLSTHDPAASIERSATDVTDASIAQIDGSEPFFGFVHYYDPHQPLAPPADLAQRFSKNPGDLYFGEIAFVDREIRRLLDHLQSLALGKQTLVIVTADHGESRGEHHEWSHGNLLHDATQHVPLLMLHPSLEPQRIGAVVSLADLVPTILEFLKKEVPLDLDGRSLLPLINGMSPASGVFAYIETQSPLSTYNWAPLYGIRTADWKFIQGARTHLYDLQNDPKEDHNVAAEFPDRTRAMRRRLKTLIQPADALQRQERTLSDADRRALGGLGYLSDGTNLGIEDHSDLPDPIDSSAELERLKRAMLMMNARRYREAAASMQELARKLPRTFIIRQNLALCYEAMQQYDRALAECQAALELRPRSAVIHMNTAVAAQKTGQLELAREHLRTAISLPGCPVKAYFLLAGIHRSTGKETRARQVLEDLLKLDHLTPEQRQEALRLLQ